MNVTPLADRHDEAGGGSSALTIGAILVDEGKLSLYDAERVLEVQKREGLRFGDAAIKLRVVSAEDIQRALALQYKYSYLLPEDGNLSPELVAAFSPFSVEVEALRGLRSHLMLRWFTSNTKPRTLAIVSPHAKEGRSYLAANLAIVFSQLGERTLLIDADLRNPRQHTLFRILDQAGLSTILAGRADEKVLQRIAGFRGLSVLSAGPIPPNPLELLEGSSFARLLRLYEASFDVILLDTPAGLANADASAIAERAGGSLIIVRQDVTPESAVEELQHQLALTGSKVVGGVLANF
jgi:protein-tyrosine kinase